MCSQTVCTQRWELSSYPPVGPLLSPLMCYSDFTVFLTLSPIFELHADMHTWKEKWHTLWYVSVSLTLLSFCPRPPYFFHFCLHPYIRASTLTAPIRADKSPLGLPALYLWLSTSLLSPISRPLCRPAALPAHTSSLSQSLHLLLSPSPPLSIYTVTLQKLRIRPCLYLLPHSLHQLSTYQGGSTILNIFTIFVLFLLYFYHLKPVKLSHSFPVYN